MRRRSRTCALAACLSLGLASFSAVVQGADPAITVRSGDTLSEIAERHGVPLAEIAALNDLRNPHLIYAGQRLRLRPAQATTTAATPPAASPTRHVVRPGEHLTGIARRHGTTIAAIAAINLITNPSRIYAGQTLTIPPVSGSSAPAASSGRPMPTSMAQLVAGRQSMRDAIEAEARRQGVDPAFALAVAWQESGWQQGVVSSAGAVGVMQLLPTTGSWVAESILRQPVDIHDARSNIRAGVALLRHYLVRYGDRQLALAAYYQGQRGTDRHGIYASSRPYIASIMVLTDIFASN